MFTIVVVAVALLLGASNAEEGGRIVGGEQTTIDRFPYQVSLRQYSQHICGGSIVSSTVIVTASHCVKGAAARDLSVRVGSSKHTSGGTIVNVQKIVMHPYYNSNSQDYDVAVLILSSSLSSVSGIKSIPFCTQQMPVNSWGVVSGWGTMQSGASTLPEYLRAVQVPRIDDARCKQEYGQNAITPNMFCAGLEEGGIDSCQGDSGGPLNYGGKLCGIVSWGVGCAAPGYAGVYTSIPKVLPFIQQYV